MHYLLHRFGSRYGRPATGFTERTVDRLMAYNVPGNIRELENMIERAVILLADGGPIDVAHVFSLSGGPDIPFYGLAPDGRLTLGESGQLPLHGRARTLVQELLQEPCDRGRLPGGEVALRATA
jgi:two-component system response regulator HydG